MFTELSLDSNWADSTSNTLHQTINQASTSTTVTSSPNPSNFGSPVTFTATVSVTSPGAGTPTGTVTFKDSGNSIGTGTLVGGTPDVATLTSSPLTVLGNHSITAVFSGDTNYSGSSGSVLQTVNTASTSTSVSSSSNPSNYGSPVTFTATVSVTSPGAGTPTGTVTFKDGGNSIGTGTLVGGTPDVATLTSSPLTVVGNHSITAVFSGDTNYSGNSGSMTQTVINLTTTATVNSNNNPSTSGQAITFTASVTSGTGTPTGTVTFKIPSVNYTIGTATLNGLGVATFTTPAAPTYGAFTTVGIDSIVAIYSGDSTHAGTTSPTYPQTVNAVATTSTTATMSSNNNPSPSGQPITFTASVTGGPSTPTGTVTFKIPEQWLRDRHGHAQRFGRGHVHHSGGADLRSVYHGGHRQHRGDLQRRQHARRHHVANLSPDGQRRGDYQHDGHNEL